MGATVTTLPLESIRVIDLTGMLAGPYATRLLADMGAETIKVESTHRYDLTRGPIGGVGGARVYPNGDPAKRPINRSSYFNEMNRNKLGLTLDLQTERGRDAFLRLVSISDVVIENFSTGVMERLGLGYGALRAVKPGIVVVSMPAFGNSGPWRDAVAYGNTIEMLSGMAAVNGYPDSMPITSSLTYGDPVAGVHAAFATLAALEHRERTGEGQFIDLSQLETLLQFLGDVVVDYSMNDRFPERSGNRDPAIAPHGIYPAAGEGAWVAITARDDAEWDALCEVLGHPEWLDDARFATPLARYSHQEELDVAIGAWTVTVDPREAMVRLQAAGIPASAVFDAADIAADPHIAARGYFELVEHPEAGSHLYPGLPWKMSGIGRAIRFPAPLLGQHNHHVLCDLVGLSEAEFSALESAGVIGAAPVPPAAPATGT